MNVTEYADHIYPVYVPSKGRPDSKLFNELDMDTLAYYIVVEPQDERAYCDFGYSVTVLPEDNHGLAYARNFILEHARNEGYDKIWMMDDDITGVAKAVEGKNISIPVGEVLARAQNPLHGVAQGALEYSQFAWSAKEGDVSQGGYCDVCVLIDLKQTVGIQYRSEVNLKEDREFTLQVLAAGLKTRRTSWLSFSCPENGSNKGGLYNEYHAGKEKAAAERLAQLWPHCVTVKQKKSGRWDAKIDWRNVMQGKMVFG